ncbi:pyocin knob domain-containing protein [Kingella kingae]|uniref:pyocin knob domain-containing protein n=1 Tax=Kingella kingae TaxID=504 RepID=UPI0002584B19|nr:pyocin knob domain-containing protein [Kingella kingae]EIC13932.1 phage tail fiber protein [Kingella kingae PYKK081]MDK4567842.1 pyocin knob domain-containing protein [Kingella kingae]MDK4569845.1 pyocin knob domain-containing protein [Kingella kingae]MDK4571762.1 pyocin knob domain-containing protein [Kingella kingae]MDK4597809.1 pyocin knob domain-containing protein [Kingella kingae]
MQAIETQDKQFHDGNGTTELGTILPAWWLNQIQAEMLAVLTAAKVSPSKAKTNQLAEAIGKLLTGSVVDNLTSTNTDKPLSAKQGKALSEQITAAISGSLNLRGALGSRNLNDLFGTANYGVWDNYANVNATLEKNYPTTKAGTLFVLPSAYQGVQLYIPFDQSVLYIRHTTNNSNPTAFSTWRSIGEVVNALNDASTTAALTAAMGKKLNDEKLGNTGNQTLSGSLNINNPNQWEKLRFQTNSGYWRFETNPKGASEAGGKRFNFVFTGADSQEKARVVFSEASGAETVAYQSWVNSQLSGKLGNTGTQELAGHLVVKYANDWVGMVAHNPTPNKHAFFDGVVNNIPKGGLQIIANDNGAYFVRITATPQGNASQDRRVASADFYAGSIWTHAYGWLHEGFVRAGNGIGQEAKHQIKIGWSDDRRLKATVDETDLGGIVTDAVLRPHLDNINNGIHNHVQNLLNILNNKAERAHFTHTDYPNHYAGAEVWRMPNNLKITIMQIKGAQRGNIYYLPEAYQGRFIAIGNDYGGGANAVTTTPIHGTNQIRINASGPTTDVNIIAIGWANNGY